MIIHSPKPWSKFLEEEPYFEGNREAWRALEEAYKEGKLRSIGVWNFEERDLDNIFSSGYCLQLNLLPLPKTANPQHMKTNAEVDFVISEEDMEQLKNMQQIENYGAHSRFPVFGKA